MKYSIPVFLFVSCLCACNSLPVSMQDSPIEEKIEDVIQEKTGIKVDFSGDTPEGASK